jgi:hypothetical protein
LEFLAFEACKHHRNNSINMLLFQGLVAEAESPIFQEVNRAGE